MELDGQVIRVFFKDQMGGANPYGYLDIRNANSFEVGISTLVVHKETEVCYYPLNTIAAFKVIKNEKI